MTKKNRKKTKRSSPIVLSIADLGGYGDIIAGATLYENLRHLGCQEYLRMGDATREKFLSISGKKQNEIRVAKEKIPLHSILVGVVKENQQLDEMRSRINVHVEEYDRSERNHTGSVYTPARPSIEIKPGFGYGKKIADVQPGMFIKKQLEELLDEYDSAKESEKRIRAMKEKMLKDIFGDTGRVFLKDHIDALIGSRLAVYYTSVLDLRNELTYFDALKLAESRLDRPICVFSVQPKKYQEDVMEKAKTWGFNYYSLEEMGKYKKRKDNSNVTVIELGTIPNGHFQQLVAMTDSLSVVTGDQSLTEMMQKAGSENPTPFLYAMASWKRDLCENLIRLIGQTSKNAADLFCSYLRIQDAGFSLYKKREVNRMSRLFYDQETIDDYTNALSKVKYRFIKQRQDAGIKRPDLLWSIGDTVGYIVEGLNKGKTGEELVEDLVPPAALKAYLKE